VTAGSSNSSRSSTINADALGVLTLVNNGAASTDRVTTPLLGTAFPLITGDRIRFAGSLGGVEAGRDYYVLNPIPVSGEFQIATTPNGNPIDISAAGPLQGYRPADATADAVALATGVDLDRTASAGLLAGTDLDASILARQEVQSSASSVDGDAVAGLNRLGSLEGIDLDPVSRVIGLESTTLQAGSDAGLLIGSLLAASADARSVSGDASTELNGLSVAVAQTGTTPLTAGGSLQLEANADLDLAANSTSTDGQARAIAGAGAGARGTADTYGTATAVSDSGALAGDALAIDAAGTLNLAADASTSGGSRSLTGASAAVGTVGTYLQIFNHRLNEGDVLRTAATGAGLQANTDYFTRLVVFGAVDPTNNRIAWGNRDASTAAVDLQLPVGTEIRFGLNSSSAQEGPASRYGLNLGKSYYIHTSDASGFKVSSTPPGVGVLPVDLTDDITNVDEQLIDIDRVQLGSTAAATDATLVTLTTASGLTLSRPSAAVALAGSRQDETSLTSTATLYNADQIGSVSGIDGNAGALRSLIAGAGAAISAFADGVLSAFSRNTDGDATAAAGTVATGLRDAAITSGSDASIEAVADLQATAEALTTGSPLAASTDPVLDDAVANLNLTATGLLASGGDTRHQHWC